MEYWKCPSIQDTIPTPSKTSWATKTMSVWIVQVDVKSQTCFLFHYSFLCVCVCLPSHLKHQRGWFECRVSWPSPLWLPRAWSKCKALFKPFEALFGNHRGEHANQYWLACWGPNPACESFRKFGLRVCLSKQSIWRFRRFCFSSGSLEPIHLNLQRVWLECGSLKLNPLKLQRVWSECSSLTPSPPKLHKVWLKCTSPKPSHLKLQRVWLAC